MPSPVTKLTDDEGAFLALLIRVEPATTYQIAKIYAESPVSNFGTSKGKVYPLARRLEKRGLVEARAVEGDSRGSEQLVCTSQGKRAVHAWIMDIRPHHVLLDDPLRTKVQSFNLLSKNQRLEWIADAKAALQGKLEELESYGKAVTVPFKDLVHDNAVSSVRARLDWLDRMLISTVRGGEGVDPDNR